MLRVLDRCNGMAVASMSAWRRGGHTSLFSRYCFLRTISTQQLRYMDRTTIQEMAEGEEGPGDHSKDLGLKGRTPAQFWRVAENRKAFMDKAAASYGVQKLQDWSHVTAADLKRVGGRALLEQHGSVANLVGRTYGKTPESLQPGSKVGVPSGYWSRLPHRADLLRLLAVKHDVKEAGEWCKISSGDVKKHRGGGDLLLRYSGSLLLAAADTLADEEEVLRALHHERSALISRPRGFWSDKERRAKFLEEAGRQLGVRVPEDWRRVTAKDVRALGGSGLLDHFGGSLWQALAEQHGTLLARGSAGMGGVEGRQFLMRSRLPHGYWKSEMHVLAFIYHAAEELGLKEPTDWYRVSLPQVRQVEGGRSFLASTPLLEALQLAYPEVEWDSSALSSSGKKATQRVVTASVAALLPHANVVENYRHPELYTSGGPSLELDIFLPELKLAVEYNGPQHYEEIPFFGPLEVIQARDARKQRMCTQLGIRLAVVPYWWDGTTESLAASLHEAAPGVLSEAASKLA